MSLGKCQASASRAYETATAKTAPTAATHGRARGPTATIAHSARDIEAVACPLGQDAGGMWSPARNAHGRGSASAGLRTWVVTLAAASTTGIISATRGRPRATAIA